ncbi:hypothetical protein EDC04DRAFT_2736189 [Pisolithus marmoratus]|nr:hypothetical protein EDC04DRAFT_2736189 [Pisolithus marmoratus]
MHRVYAHSFKSSMWLDLFSDPPFSHGKGADDLIPMVYTLSKKYDLLPCITTPASVIPVLVGGADLMIPGVVQIPSSQTVVPPQLSDVWQRISTN